LAAELGDAARFIEVDVADEHAVGGRRSPVAEEFTFDACSTTRHPGPSISAPRSRTGSFRRRPAALVFLA
jgi:hypothetical protein